MRMKGKRILVVDDEPAIQRALRRNLIAAGYEVLIVDDGMQAVELVREHQPDLILLDICLPGDLDGVDVCVQVRRFSQTPIIVLSALAQQQVEVIGLLSGADTYLYKPVDLQTLIDTVERVLKLTAQQRLEHDQALAEGLFPPSQ